MKRYSKGYLQGHDFKEAVDGREGVTVFEREEHFEYVLVKLDKLTPHLL